jgi:hypothetical protein
VGTRNDDISLILAKAKKQGFFPNVNDSEVDVLTREAAMSLGDDIAFNRKTYKLRGLANFLKNPFTSTGVQATGDSTTTPDSAWFRLLANQCATEYPKITHHYRKWNDATQDFDRPIILNTSAAGRRAMVTQDTAGTRCGIGTDGSTNITGDIDIRVDIKPPGSWVSGTSVVLASKWTIDSSLSWAFYLNSTGALRFSWSSDGVFPFPGGQDKTSNAIVPFTSNTEGWVRVVLDVDNGSAGNDVKFYTSTDAITWTQLGTTITTAGVTSIAASNSRYTLGARGGSSTPFLLDTRAYEIQIRDGINGPSVVPYLPDMWDNTIGNGIPTFEGAPVLTWIMSAQPGAGIGYDVATIGYLSDPLRMRKMAPIFNNVAMFFSSSHNEYNLHGNLWAQKYKTWVDTISQNALLAERIILTQNPRTGTADDLSITNPTGIGPRVRRSDMFAFSKRQGLEIIDTYQAFIDDGRDMPTALIGDTVHPTAEGYIVWKNAIKEELDCSLARTTAY